MAVNKKNLPKGLFSLLFVIVFILFFLVYYFVPFFQSGTETILLTLSTFLFAIFAGFSISRQNSRHTILRDELASLDGLITEIYRNFEYFGDSISEKAKKIISDHYRSFVGSSDAGLLMLNKKVSLLHPLYELLGEAAGAVTLSAIQNEATRRIGASLAELQVLRKRIISLYAEKLPVSQWLLMYVLMFILIAMLSVMIESQGVVFVAIVKSAFASAMIFIMFLLHRLANLSFYERILGDRSAEDVLDVIEGRK